MEGAKDNIPDEDSLEACNEILATISRQNLEKSDVVFVLISGGGSALLPAPIQGLSLATKQEIISTLSKGGADIVELNTVRKALSKVKGGKLAQLLYPAQVVSLIISDVIGDRLDIIASGPTAPSPVATDSPTCKDILQKYDLIHLLPQEVNLEDNNESLPAPDVFKNVDNIIFSCNKIALDKSTQIAQKLGYATLLVSNTTAGEAKTVGSKWALIAKSFLDEDLDDCFNHLKSINYAGNIDQVKSLHNEFATGAPILLLGGGETTVKVVGGGKGGRNQELVLAFALHAKHILVEESCHVEFMSCGTDGIDGPTDAAGAVVSRSIWMKSQANSQLHPKHYLDSNNSYHFWDTVGGLVKTGHTGTNVMDIQMLTLRQQRRGGKPLQSKL